MERGAPSALLPVTMLAGRSVELVAGLALILRISLGRTRPVRIPLSLD